jgi:hypothetical protein
VRTAGTGAIAADVRESSSRRAPAGRVSSWTAHGQDTERNLSSHYRPRGSRGPGCSAVIRAPSWQRTSDRWRAYGGDPRETGCRARLRRTRPAGRRCVPGGYDSITRKANRRTWRSRRPRAPVNCARRQRTGVSPRAPPVSAGERRSRRNVAGWRDQEEARRSRPGDAALRPSAVEIGRIGRARLEWSLASNLGKSLGLPRLHGLNERTTGREVVVRHGSEPRGQVVSSDR